MKNYLKECAEAKVAAERAAKEAAFAALDLDIDSLDNLPDKLVLKTAIREKKPRKPRDPTKTTITRRRRVADKNVIIAEDSQIDSPAYIRKIVTTPEQSPEERRANKRKSKHVIIEDIFVGDRNKKPATKISASPKENSKDSMNVDDDEPTFIKPERKKKQAIALDEPIFEDDDDFEQVPTPKRATRAKK